MKKMLTFLLVGAMLLSIMCLSACSPGQNGIDGSDGQNGLSAYELAVQQGFEGTLDEWLASLKGADGKDGADGEDGKDGVDGSNGADGSDGVDGTPSAVLEAGYVMITDYAKPNTGADVSDAIQKAIDENPNKTIFFPDGTYLLSKPIVTPAIATKSVSLQLANYAILKATDSWSSTEAVVRLGGKDGSSDITTLGSNYFFKGGMIDGNGKAKGVSIDSGRETLISGVSMKNVYIGIHIKNGANNGSSDSDVMNVNIVGTNTPGSTGVFVEGFDNTFTNMRICEVQYGMHFKGGGNFIKNVHPLYIWSDSINYAESIGFWEETAGNFYDNAYSDQFSTAFKLEGWLSVLNSCFAWWYSNMGPQTAFYCTGGYNSIITTPRVQFNGRTDCTFFYTMYHSNGDITNPIFNKSACDPAKNNYSNYVTDGEILNCD